MRTYLTADHDIHVNAATGNDATADGTPALPFQTLQAARNLAQDNFDVARQWAINFRVAPGTYAGLYASGPMVGQSSPWNEHWHFDNCVIEAPNSNCVMAIYGAQLVISAVGTTLKAPGAAGVGLNASFGGFISMTTELTFQDCGNSFLQTSWGGMVIVNSCYFSGNAYSAIYASGGVIQVNPGSTIHVLGCPTFTKGFAWAFAGGIIGCAGSNMSGPALCPHYACEYCGIIETGVGGNPYYFPGNAPGGVSFGGQYN